MVEENTKTSLDSKKFQQYIRDIENKNSSQNSTGDINQVQTIKRQREENEDDEESKSKKRVYSIKGSQSSEGVNDKKNAACGITGTKYKQYILDICGDYKSPLFKIEQIKRILEIDNIIEIICDFSSDQIFRTKVCQSDQELYFLTEQGVNELTKRLNNEKAREFQEWMNSLQKQLKIASISQLEQVNVQLQKKIYEQQNMFQLQETLYNNEIKKKEKYIEGIPKLGQINMDYAFINDKNYFRIGQENMNEKRELGERSYLYTQKCINEENLQDQIQHVLTNMEYYRKDQKAYKCKMETIKTVTQILGSTYDVLYKCREGMSLQEIQEKIQQEQEKYVQEEKNTKNRMLIKM